MPIVSDLQKVFKDALDKAKDIAKKASDDVASAYNGWDSDSPIPNISVEDYDYAKHFAEGVSKACSDSMKAGQLIIPPPMVAGATLAPTGAYVSTAPLICKWDDPGGSALKLCQNTILLAVSNPHAGMTNPLTWTDIANAVHTMIMMGEISGQVIGMVTTPSVPPVVVPGIPIKMSGALLGPPAALISSWIGAATGCIDNTAFAAMLGAGFMAHVATLNGVVTGMKSTPPEPGVAGAMVGMIVT